MGRKKKSINDIAESSKTTDKKRTEGEKQTLRNEIKHRLRFQILERDGFTCKYCGRSPRKGDDIELKVDHIIPVEKGGGNEENNLITSCGDCNEGKKNHLLESNKYNFNDKDVIEKLNIENDSKKIKDYFNSEGSSHNRKVLHQLYEEDTRCIKDCTSCIENDTIYLQCFEDLVYYLKVNKIETVERGEKINPLFDNSSLMKCNNCYLADRCPKFKLNSNCAYDFTLDTDFSDVDTALQMLVNVQKERVIRASLFERVDGGVPDKNLSNEISLLSTIIQQIDERQQEKGGIHIHGQGKEGVGVVRDLLSNIFSGNDKKSKEIPHKQHKALPEKRNLLEINQDEIKDMKKVKILKDN